MKNNKYLQGFLLTAVFFILLHCTFVGLFSDDEWFLEMITEASSLKSLLIERYETWTSRLITEAVCFELVRMPFFVWCILDVLICLLTYHSLTVIFVNDKESKANIWVFLVFAIYPFMHMASAGWLSTTLNYLWPFTFAVYALSGAVRQIRGEKLKWYSYILYFLSLIFAVNCEMPAAYVLLVFLGCVGYRILSKKKPVNVYEIVTIILAIAAIIFAFTCPGNQLRTEIEVRWMPEFPDLNILEKFRLCAVFVFEHFVAIPDVPFFLFSLMLMLAGIRKSNKWYINTVAAIPLAIDIIFTSVYFINDFIIGHKRAYDYSYPAVYMSDAHTIFVQLSELAGLFIYIAAAIFTLICIFKDAKRRYISIWALGSGFAVRMSLMLSATMFVSWHRTLIYFYFAILLVSVMLMDELKTNWQKLSVYVVIGLGIAVNLVLTVGHQLRIRG